MKAENYIEEQLELRGVPLRVITYKAGDQYYCHVSNADPGAVIARAAAPDGNEAKRIALKKAEERLKR